MRASRPRLHKLCVPSVCPQVLIGFYMIAVKVGEVYEVPLPPIVTSVLASMSVGISFGFNGVSAVLECLHMGGYVATLALHMAVPAVLAVAILLAVALRTLYKTRCTSLKAGGTLVAVLQTSAPLILKLFFIAYPLVSSCTPLPILCPPTHPRPPRA